MPASSAGVRSTPGVCAGRITPRLAATGTSRLSLPALGADTGSATASCVTARSLTSTRSERVVCASGWSIDEA